VQNINKIKQIASIPVSVGFGVSTPEQARMIGEIADGVIVGSAIVKEIGKNRLEDINKLVDNVGKFVEKLVIGAKG